MVVRRPDGLGTARVTSVNDGSMSQLSEIDLKIESSIVRPHSTVQRAHSTVIPRGSKLKVMVATCGFLNLLFFFIF